jgi:hypothetical protein
MDIASNLPWWDDPTMPVDVGDRLRSLCRLAKGWPVEAGPSPTSGERTALHDRIARSPGFLADLERIGIEFPSALRDEADLVNSTPPVKRCCQCAKSRRVTEFLTSSLSDDGLTDRCVPCVLANAARDRAEREARRQHASATLPATRAAARGPEMPPAANLPPSANERTARHV